MLYISHTGCQWRFLPEEFGPWTRIWSQFRRWSRNGTWTRVLVALHASSRIALGRKDPRPSMVVIDTHLARGPPMGGATFHNQGGPYGRTNRAKRFVLRGRHGPAALRARGARFDVRSQRRRTDNSTTWSSRVRTNGWNSCSWTAAPARSGATRLSAKFNYEVRPCWMGRATAQRARAPRSFAPSAMPGG